MGRAPAICFFVAGATLLFVCRPAVAGCWCCRSCCCGCCWSKLSRAAGKWQLQAHRASASNSLSAGGLPSTFAAREMVGAASWRRQLSGPQLPAALTICAQRPAQQTGAKTGALVARRHCQACRKIQRVLGPSSAHLKTKHHQAAAPCLSQLRALAAVPGALSVARNDAFCTAAGGLALPCHLHARHLPRSCPQRFARRTAATGHLPRPRYACRQRLGARGSCLAGTRCLQPSLRLLRTLRRPRAPEERLEVPKLPLAARPTHRGWARQKRITISFTRRRRVFFLRKTNFKVCSRSRRKLR